MEQLVIVILIVGLIFMAEKTHMGIYKIIAGFLSFGLAIMVMPDLFFTGILVSLALYLIISVFVNFSGK